MSTNKSIPVMAIAEISEQQLIDMSHAIGGSANNGVFNVREAERALPGLRAEAKLRLSVWGTFKAEIRRRLDAGQFKNKAEAESLLAWGHDFEVQL